MKTMRSRDGKRIWRATDERASQLYQDGDATYATKEEWKNEVRDWVMLFHHTNQKDLPVRINGINLPKHRNDK